MAVSPEPLKGGFDVDENAIRFSNYFHVLRELVHLSCGHLPLEPRFEVKSLIGDHVHDDARTVSKLRRRLYELRTPSDYPGEPRSGACAGSPSSFPARSGTPPSCPPGGRPSRSTTSARCPCGCGRPGRSR